MHGGVHGHRMQGARVGSHIKLTGLKGRAPDTSDRAYVSLDQSDCRSGTGVVDAGGALVSED
jgi:hypothetical protein